MARNRPKKNTKIINKSKILVIADGVTEINYLKGYIEKHTNLAKKSDIKYVPNKLNTHNIYYYIKSVEATYDYIFAFSDKDNNNNKKDTFNNFCKCNDIFDNVITGYSNPCFELWLYLHFEFREVEISIKELNKYFLKKLGKKYKSKEDILDYFIEYLDVAKKNSLKLDMFWRKDKGVNKFADMNPSTSVHKIINKIDKLK